MSTWTKSNIQKWCWKFILNNNRFPTDEDLSSTDYSHNSPSSASVTQLFNSLNELIENCGPMKPYKNGFSPTFKEIKTGFKRFFDEHGHFPSANEIDLCEYLIKSRSIQRSWGGLPNLRKLMGMDTVDYGRGQNRRIIAERIGKRSFIEEAEFEKILVDKFGEIFVHTQKRIGNINVDFYIYSPLFNFGIDVFNYETDHDLKGIINLKQKTYKLFPYNVIFIPMNQKKSQTELDEIISKKDNPLPNHCKLFSVDYFIKWIQNLNRYKDPEK